MVSLDTGSITSLVFDAAIEQYTNAGAKPCLGLKFGHNRPKSGRTNHAQPEPGLGQRTWPPLGRAGPQRRFEPPIDQGGAKSKPGLKPGPSSARVAKALTKFTNYVTKFSKFSKAEHFSHFTKAHQTH